MTRLTSYCESHSDPSRGRTRSISWSGGEMPESLIQQTRDEVAFLQRVLRKFADQRFTDGEGI